MGWKGTVRSIGAAARKADRNAKRRQRELDKRRKEVEKMEQQEQAAYEVDVFENYLELIQSVHKDCSEPIDWVKVKNAPEPEQPTLSKTNEERAQKKYSNFKPNILNKLLGNSEKKKNKLKTDIQHAKEKDEEKHKELLAEYTGVQTDWAVSKDIAQQLIKGDSKAKLEAIKEFSPFSEIDTIGSNITININEGSLIEVSINIHSSEIVPAEQKSLLKSGKLSIKKMPVGKFNEIFQDYVCSVILRVANEIFAIIPDKYVLINAKDKLLNSSTGHIEEQIIVSTYIPKETIRNLNMESIDPSDSMSNYITNMNFKKTKGFVPVKQVEIKK